jgi:hypothetical protein
MSKPVTVLVTIERSEGYEDVHPELVVADFFSKPDNFSFHVKFVPEPCEKEPEDA